MRPKFKWPPLAILILVTQALMLHSTPVVAANTSDGTDYYQIQPGDILLVSVWKEEDLTQQIVVRPDGRINLPLAGEISAAGNSVENLRKRLTEKLRKYIPDPVLTVSVQQLLGNKIYVIGKVNRPGEFAIVRKVDVMQALSIAGGTSTYAALNKIKILRRKNGTLQAIPFEYGEVEKGKHLEQNIVLQAGDVVVVP
ncbi:MAG: polysaccharide export protein [Gammaproteobacteria bacterium]|nr:polysaccharide export protein [Gammaproteobacteria bacterium]